MLLIDCGNQDHTVANVCTHVIMQPTKAQRLLGSILCGAELNMPDPSSRALP